MQKLFLFLIGIFSTFAGFALEGGGFSAAPPDLYFIKNVGQLKDQNGLIRRDIDYKLAGNGLDIFVGNGMISYQWRGSGTNRNSGITQTDLYRVDISLLGANRNAELVASGQQSYFERYIGPDQEPGGKIANAYEKLTYKNIYPGIDWVIYIKGNKVEYDFVVREGARIADIKLKTAGAGKLLLDGNGDLVTETSMGSVTQHSPVSFQEDGKVIASRFTLKNDIVGFETGAYQGKLIIDPLLSWATYYGGTGYEAGANVRTDASGNVYMCGQASSTANIATSGAYQTVNAGGFYDFFLVKFNASGVRQWATYFGGSGMEDGKSLVALDPSGYIYLAGTTTSTSLISTAGSHQPSPGGGKDCFLAKFNGSGTLQWATYYGGSNDDLIGGLACDNSGNIILSGNSASFDNISTPGSYQVVRAGIGNTSQDAFLVKFNSSGTRLWGTYMGGADGDGGDAVVADALGYIYLAGGTGSSSNITTTGVYQETYAGAGDGFLAKFNSSGGLQWSTYYGGTAGESFSSIALDNTGNICVTGSTSSTTSIATPGCHQPSYAGGNLDAFLVKFNANGVRQWGTYMGGAYQDNAVSVGTDNSGQIYISGTTNSGSGIASGGAFHPYLNNTATPTQGYSSLNDGFLAKFDASGNRVWSSYVGGNYDLDGIDDGGGGIQVTGSGEVFMTGTTFCPVGIATAGSHQPALGGFGTSDAFLMKFVPEPPCSAQPVAGIVSGPSFICPGRPFSVGVSGNTSIYTVMGISLRWQSKPVASGQWADIAGADDLSYNIAGITATTAYRLIIRCDNTQLSDTTDPFTVSIAPGYACYCISGSSSSDFDVTISSFSIGNLVNNSLCSEKDSNYAPSLDVPVISKGSMIPWGVDISSCLNNYSVASNGRFKLFVDWNADGDYGDSLETVFISDNINGDMGNGSVSNILTVPSFAATGYTGVRIVLAAYNYGTDIDPATISACGSYTYGETEDYAINIVAPAAGHVQNLSLSAITSNSMKVSFQRGTPAGTGGVIVVAREAAELLSDPVNGISYGAPGVSSVFFHPSGTSATPWTDAGGGKVVYRTKSTAANISFNLKGLKSGVEYYFQVYEYDSSASGTVYVTQPHVAAMAATLVTAPSNAASNLTISNLKANSFDVRVNRGNGLRRLIVAKAASPITTAPVDNTSYTASAAFGMGSDLGNGSFAVYNDTDSTVTLTGLLANTKYHIKVFEYNTYNGITDYAAGGLGGYTTTPEDYVSLTAAGIAVSESFNDSLVMTGSSSKKPKGWHYRVAPNDVVNYSANNGSSSAGIFSYGTTGSNDRAFGSALSSSATLAAYGFKFVNKSKLTITSLLVQYTGEQWRKGGGTSASNRDSLFVEYSTNAYMFNSANAIWNKVSKLTFWSQQTGTPGAVLDGNNVANRMALSGSITGLNIPPGGQIWVRWRDKDLIGISEDGLAVDDVEVIPFSNTIVNGGPVPGAALNDLNIVGGIAVVDTAKLSIKYALNIDKDAKLSIAHNTLKRALVIGNKLYGTGTISSGKLSAITVAGPKVATATGFNQTLYFTPGSNDLAGLTIKGNGYVNLGNALNMTALPKAGVVRVGSYSASTGASVPATLNTNNNLTLKSDTLGTATIGAIYGSITGDITQERAMQNRAAHRLISHPFSTAIPLSQVNDDVSLVFTAGNRNIWYYNQATGNPAGITDFANIANWTPFTAVANNWNQYQTIRLFKGAGPATIDMSGPVNQGNVTVTSTANSQDSLVVIGNPYPAGVKIGAVLTSATGPITAGVMNGSAVWTWNPTKGTDGAFVAVPSAKIPALTIPVNAAIIARVNPGATASLYFMETDKAGTASTKSYFRPDGEEAEEEVAEEQPEIFLNEGLQLVIEQNGHEFDATYVYFDKDALEAEEKQDAPKLSNPNFNFYSLSSGAERLSIDVRPFQTGKTIPLGLVTTALGDYKMKVADYNLQGGTELYLADKFRGTEELITANTGYRFTIDSREGSQGTGRFSLRMGKTTTPAATLSMELIPNPATAQVTIHLNAEQEGKAQVRILSITGQQMVSIAVESVRHSQVSIPLTNLAAGIYMVELKTADGQKLIKQLVKQ